MQVKTSDLEALLLAEGNRQAIARTDAELGRLRTGSDLKALEDKRIELAGRLSTASADLESLRLSQERAATDLQLVESRIERDLERLKTSTSPKDISGIQHELDTLAKRKSELEDVELGLLEEIESQSVLVAEMQTERELLSEQLRVAHDKLSAQLAQLEDEKNRLTKEMQGKLADIDRELAAVYLAKSARGVGIGRLANLTCSACNMGITSSAYRELTAAAPDALLTCPECSAILVRS